jgi:hypothetical protein
LKAGIGLLFGTGSQCGSNGIKNGVKVFANISGQKSQNQISVLLEQRIFSAVPPVGIDTGEMLLAVQFDANAGIGAKQIHFHRSHAVKWDRQVCV